MAKPANSVATVKLPSDSSARYIVPYYLAYSKTNNYIATLPDLTADDIIVTTKMAQTISGDKTFSGNLDVSGGILKFNVINAKTSSSATTYGPGTSGQVLKSNGTNAYWGNDASDNTSQGITAQYKWKNQMAGYQVFIADKDNKLVPMVTGASGTASTGTSKTMNTTVFNPFGLIGATTSSSYKAADALCSSSTWVAYSAIDLRYSFNCGSTLTANTPVYIVAQMQSGGQAKLVSPYYTQTLPSSDDDKIYIYLGQAISTTSINLQEVHPIYYYKNSELKLFTALDADLTAIAGLSGTSGFLKKTAANTWTLDTNTYLTSHQSIKSLKTDNTATQSTSASEAIAGSGTINLHKVAKTGKYSDLIGTPTIPTGFTITVTDDILDGTGGTNSVKYAPYSSKGAGHLYTGTTAPTSSNRLNYDGYFYATKVYSGSTEIMPIEIVDLTSL